MDSCLKPSLHGEAKTVGRAQVAPSHRPPGVEAGRVCQAETLERTVAYLDSWSPVSFVGEGILEVEKGLGIGILRGPSVGSLKGSSSSELEVLEEVARSPDVE